MKEFFKSLYKFCLWLVIGSVGICIGLFIFVVYLVFDLFNKFIPSKKQSRINIYENTIKSFYGKESDLILKR